MNDLTKFIEFISEIGFLFVRDYEYQFRKDGSAGIYTITLNRITIDTEYDYPNLFNKCGFYYTMNYELFPSKVNCILPQHINNIDKLKDSFKDIIRDIQINKIIDNGT